MDHYFSRFQSLSDNDQLSHKAFSDNHSSLGFPYIGLLVSNCFQILSFNTQNQSIPFQDYISFINLCRSTDSSKKSEFIFKFISGKEKGITIEAFSRNFKELQRLFRKLTGSSAQLTDADCHKLFKKYDKSQTGLIDFLSFSDLCAEKEFFIEWNGFILFAALTEDTQPKNSLGYNLDMLVNVELNLIVPQEHDFFYDISPSSLLTLQNFYNPTQALTWLELKQLLLQECSMKTKPFLTFLQENLPKLDPSEIFSHPIQRETPDCLSLPSTWFLLSSISQHLSAPLPKLVLLSKANNIFHSFHLIPHYSETFQIILSQYSSGLTDLSAALSLSTILPLAVSQDFALNPWQPSAGKSSSHFCPLSGEKFLLKTASDSDLEFVSNFIKLYSEHLNANPESLLCRLFGLFTFKEFQALTRTKIHVLLMNDLLEGFCDEDLIFDLKGSTVGRLNDGQYSRMNPHKDLEMNKMQFKVCLTPEDRGKVMNQLKSDFAFLEKMSITDYSLVLGVKEVRGEVRQSYFRYLSACGRFLYSFGVIDFFSVFSFKKQVELMFKSSLYGKGVSCLPPKEYRERIIKYLESVFQ